MQKLETRDGALLCGDDLLKDVIDDKEILGLNIFCFRIQTLTIFIVAVFDDFDEEEDTLEGIIYFLSVGNFLLFSTEHMISPSKVKVLSLRLGQV